MFFSLKKISSRVKHSLTIYFEDDKEKKLVYQPVRVNPKTVVEYPILDDGPENTRQNKGSGILASMSPSLVDLIMINIINSLLISSPT